MPWFQASARRSPTPAPGSSPTWWPTSARSSTSEHRPATRPSVGRRLAGLVRLGHPFPSILDGITTGAVVLLAGGTPATAVTLGVSMMALQASIGALNDLVDAPTDHGHKPGKPIPAGLVGADAARICLVTAAGLGVLLAAGRGPGLVALAGLVLVIGYGYDLFAKGTAWSWLPFALGIPLLPVYGWYGVDGRLPESFALLLPAGVAAGAALAIANARVDLGRDRAAGLDSVAARLGDVRAWSVGLALLLGVIVLAVGTLLAGGPDLPHVAPGAAASLVIGLGIVWAGPNERSQARRERAWQVQAIGVALLAAAWLAATGATGER